MKKEIEDIRRNFVEGSYFPVACEKDIEVVQKLCGIVTKLLEEIKSMDTEIALLSNNDRRIVIRFDGRWREGQL
jgi:hypothetical protein